MASDLGPTQIVYFVLVLGKGWLLFGQALFKSVKSMHICHAAFDFLTTTILANNYEY